MTTNNQNESGKAKGPRPYITSYLANGPEDANGNPTINVVEENGKRFYQDQVLVGWKRTGQHGTFISGLLGLQDDKQVMVSFRPAYVLFERIEETDDDGKKTYRDGREPLGIVQILERGDKKFPITHVFAEGEQGGIELVRAIGFVNGDVPGDGDTTSDDTDKAADKPAESAKSTSKTRRISLKRKKSAA